MNKRRSWRFSSGGAALFFLLLCAPLFIGLVRRWPHGASQLWDGLLFLALIIFLGIVWFLSLRPLIRQGLWKFPRTWYEGFFGITFLCAFYALFVFITGHTPSKFSSHSVPRSAGFVYLYWAAGPLIIGCAFYLYEKYGRHRAA